MPLLNIDKIQDNLDLGSIEGLNEAAFLFAGELSKEIPGNPIQKIIIRPASKQGDQYVVSVGFEDEGVLKWIWAYWKGEPNEITIYPRFRKWLRFFDWYRGNDSLRWKIDNAYHFTQVQHIYPPHPFVENATSNFWQVANVISNRLQQRLK